MAKKKKKKTKSEKRFHRRKADAGLVRLLKLKEDCEIALESDPEYYDNQEDLETFYQEIKTAIKAWKQGDQSAVKPIQARFVEFNKMIARSS